MLQKLGQEVLSVGTRAVAVGIKREHRQREQVLVRQRLHGGRVRRRDPE